MEKVVGKNFEQVSPDKGEFLTIILGGIISLSLPSPSPPISDSLVVTETTSILRTRSLLLPLNGL